MKERNTETGGTYRRIDLWPLFTYRRDYAGKEHLQVLSVIEPVLPYSKSIDRDYSQLYSIWRGGKRTRKTGAQQPVAALESVLARRPPAVAKKSRSCSVFCSINLL